MTPDVRCAAGARAVPGDGEGATLCGRPSSLIEERDTPSRASGGVVARASAGGQRREPRSGASRHHQSRQGHEAEPGADVSAGDARWQAVDRGDGSDADDRQRKSGGDGEDVEHVKAPRG